ncbi:MAG: hypothetical protein DCC49_13720 [Acidobacteria bacterium]|nr:MAG: hypothetical protein DCC49_13720 [Acidobacteriota bacterium]
MNRRILAFRASYVLIIVYGLICLGLAGLISLTSKGRLPGYLAVLCGIAAAAIGVLCIANGVAGIIVTVRKSSILPERTNVRWPTQGLELYIRLRRTDDTRASDEVNERREPHKGQMG